MKHLIMSANAYISHRSPDMNNNIIKIKNNSNDNEVNYNSIVNIAKLSHQLRTIT